jgi:hypothetical protein
MSLWRSKTPRLRHVLTEYQRQPATKPKRKSTNYAAGSPE